MSKNRIPYRTLMSMIAATAAISALSAQNRGRHTASAAAEGSDSTESSELAQKWLEGASVNGDHWAQYFLGVCLSTGPEFWTYKPAIEFQFGRTAAEADWKAASEAYRRFRVLWGSLSSDRRNPTKGWELLNSASEGGVAVASYMLYCWRMANWHNFFDGNSQDLKMLRRAVDQGHAIAKSEMAGLLIDGQGVPRDVPRGARLLDDAVNQGYALAIANKAYYVGNGMLGPANLKEAVRLALAAAAAGDEALGYCNAGEFLCREDHPEKDVEAGLQYLKKAVEHGSARAAYCLGNFYRKGGAIDSDIAMARRWYVRSARMGNNDALYELVSLEATSEKKIEWLKEGVNRKQEWAYMEIIQEHRRAGDLKSSYYCAEEGARLGFGWSMYHYGFFLASGRLGEPWVEVTKNWSFRYNQPDHAYRDTLRRASDWFCKAIARGRATNDAKLMRAAQEALDHAGFRCR